MTDSEITTTILRQIRDELIATRTELKQEIAATRTELKEEIGGLRGELVTTNERLSIVETVVRDAAQQIRMIGSYVKNKQEVAIDELRKRVTKLEKKVG